MSVYRGDLLAARFTALAPEPFEGDWLDVQRRARRGGRRKTLVLALVAAIASILAGSAFALGHRIVDFFSADPAPRRIVTEFKDARRTLKANWGYSLPVVESEARTILNVVFPDGATAYIAAAPALGGNGFCYSTAAFSIGGGGHRGAGCVDAKQRRTSPIFPEGNAGRATSGVMLGWRDFTGYVADPATDRLILRYEDGTQDNVPFVWVSEPINAGFFAFEPPARRDVKGHRASAFVALDATGRELARFPFTYDDGGNPWAFGLGGGWPPAIDRATVSRLHVPGVPSSVRILVAHGRHDGGLCFRTVMHGSAGGGCVAPGGKPTCCEILGSGPPWVNLIEGISSVGATVEVRYQDGRRDVVRPVGQVVVYAVPAEQYPPGHRLVSAVVHDRTGRIVAHVKWDPRWGQGYFGHPPAP